MFRFGDVYGRPSPPSDGILHFFEAICLAPLLASLDIHDYFRLSVVISSDPTSTVQLHSLKNITISDTPATCNTFLRHIAIPPDARLSVVFTCPPSIHEDYSPLMISLLRDRMQPRFMSNGKVSIFEESGHFVRINLRQVNSLVWSNGKVVAAEDDASTHFWCTSPSYITTVIETVPFSIISRFTVNCLINVTPQDWINVLPVARLLHTATVGMWAAVTFCLALDAKPEYSACFLSALQCICVSMVTFDWVIKGDLPLHDILFELFVHRRQGGVGLRRLKLEKCKVTTAHLDRLRGIPGLEVVWDGYYGFLAPPGADPIDVALNNKVQSATRLPLY
jgi:hypothetical protein